ncbi:protein ABHD15-like [Haliotis rubra]|uniref:protein ABHD15-like n=1 Tax=Haliotis rubra TaxID=36100 RepID=UPI001EE629C3|nr:protein ABHD15-like [Haliotis rubra]
MQISPEPMYVVLGSVVAIVTVAVWYYRRNKYTLPDLHYVDSNLHRHILKTKPGFTSPYRPPFWLQNNHLHTIIATFVPKPKVTFKREYVDLDDGGVVALDWAQGGSKPVSDTSTILIVVPGLTASADNMSELCNMALKRGYRVVVFNKRGHGDSVLATPKMQGFGDAKDMRHCVEYLRDKNPAAKLVSVGSSAGSGLLASYLGEYGADCHLATARTIPFPLGRNIPFHLFRENSNWLLATTSKGGHCGFLEESTLTPWSDRLALDYIDAVLEFQAAENEL